MKKYDIEKCPYMGGAEECAECTQCVFDDREDEVEEGEEYCDHLRNGTCPNDEHCGCNCPLN